MGKEIKVRYYSEQGAEELYKNIENNRVYVRQPANVPEIVFWLTSNKWQGGYEADCPIKAGITMIVVDKNENELYRETLVEDNWNSGSSASKKAPFLYEAEKEYAIEYAKEQRDERDYHILQERLRLEGRQSFPFASLICFSRESRSRSARISTSSICLSSFALLSQTSPLSFCWYTKHEHLRG